MQKAALCVVLGWIFLAMECFLPSAGLLGLLAAVCLAAGVFVAFQAGGWLAAVAIFADGALVAAVIVWLGMRRLQLKHALDAGSGFVATPDYTALRGQAGIAATDLRPAGKGRFGEMTLDVVAESAMIEKGSAIRVLRVEGARIVVGKPM